jgi:hypothetical protein
MAKAISNHGVSRFEPYPLTVAIGDAGEIRFSPVYAGHAIKPLTKLHVLPRAPAVSDRIGMIRHAIIKATGKSLLVFVHRNARPPPFEQSNMDVPEGMVSYRHEISECEHRRASNGQHARKRFCNDSFRRFQEVFCKIFYATA